MISHSPPIFSHSPPVNFLTDFMSSNHHNHHRQGLNYNDESNNRASRCCRPQVITLASKAMVNNASNALAVASATNANNNHNNNNNNSTLQQQKQRVITATKKTAATAAKDGRNIFTHSSTESNANGAGRLANGGRTGGLGRVVSAPALLAQFPKSCLSRKSCVHDCSENCLKRSQPETTPTAAPPLDATEADTKDMNKEDSEQSRARKHVIFADDEGRSLTEVRVMSEPSNVPPYWSIKFLEQITQGLVSPHPADQWTVDFKQPASDYLTFRQKIESNFVSLENVIVKDEESIVVGTIKVKNIGFEKEVIVRVTWDDWKSQQDIFCTYARAYGPTTCAHVVFDTFAFKITLPPSSKRLEFCICFRTTEGEYWDNNNGHNYTITKRSPFYYNALSPYGTTTSRQNNKNKVMSSLTEALSHLGSTDGFHDRSNIWLHEPSPYW